MTSIRPASTPSAAPLPTLKTNGNGHAHLGLVNVCPSYEWECLPEELRTRGRFVLYRNERGRKVPYWPGNPAQRAASNNPSSWAPFEQTRKAFEIYPGFDGINAVSCPEFTFVDLDDCVTDGQISAAAEEIMQALPRTYWEFSPSRTGLHGIFRSLGKLDNITQKPLEVYAGNHFMSVTGWVCIDAPIALLKPKHIEPYRLKKMQPISTATGKDASTTIPQGLRTKALLSLAGKMHYAGCDLESIERAIRDLGAKCSPPVDEKKILGIMKSAAKWSAAEQGSLLVRERQDVGNADRLLLYGRGDYRYIAAFNRWTVYDGARWPVEDREHEAIRGEAHAMVRAFAMQAALAGNQDCMKFAAESLNSARISNMLREAQPHATLTTEELDRDPLLVNFRNGTLDTRTGKLREHRREDYITALIPYDYNPKAKCPKWRGFVAETFANDTTVIEFLQRALGYSLTGDTSEKCIFLAYGPTDTGKTTLLTAVGNLLGDYAGRIKVESLMVERRGPLDANAQSDLADLRGKRFIMTSETGQGQRLREELVKLLTQGQGSYRAVRKYENPFEFPETWKLWTDCNHLPVVRGTDDAIWERLVIVPFRHTVRKTKQDKKLGQQLISEEAEGILSWLVRGLLDWAKNGLKLPASMKKPHQEWRKESDELRQWLEEKCILQVGGRASTTDLYNSYKAWRKEHGLFEESTTMFARKMKEHGFAKKEVGSAKVPHWEGIKGVKF